MNAADDVLEQIHVALAPIEMYLSTFLPPVSPSVVRHVESVLMQRAISVRFRCGVEHVFCVDALELLLFPLCRTKPLSGMKLARPNSRGVGSDGYEAHERRKQSRPSQEWLAARLARRVRRADSRSSVNVPRAHRGCAARTSDAAHADRAASARDRRAQTAPMTVRLPIAPRRVHSSLLVTVHVSPGSLGRTRQVDGQPRRLQAVGIDDHAGFHGDASTSIHALIAARELLDAFPLLTR